MSNSSSPNPFDPDNDIDSEYENEIASIVQSQFIMHPSSEEDREQYYDVTGWPVYTSRERGRRPPPQPPLAVIRDDVHGRPPMHNNTSSSFGKGKKRKNKVVNNKNKKNSNKNKNNKSSSSSSTIKVSGRTYKVQKGPRGGKFIKRGGKKVYISSKK